MENFNITDKKLQEMIQDRIQFLQLEIEDTRETLPKEEKWSTNSPTSLTCSYCRTEFSDVLQQRQHYKLDWHRYNLKQSLLSREPITEEEFDDKSDMSSISGSESDEKENGLENILSSQGKMFLKNGNGIVFSLYRCVLFEKKEELANDILLKSIKTNISNLQWTILMLGGGHFAGAVFQANTPILHKTFHCYTVRAGQGGSQGSRDNRSGGSQPKSAGASLRRYNESALIQHVTDILEDWKEAISKSSLIIYRAPGPYNRSVLFGGKNPLLNRSDCRLRTIPFSTRRATFTEVKRVYSLLATINVYDSLDTVLLQFPKTEPSEQLNRRNKNKPGINRSKSREITERPLDNESKSSSGSSDDCNEIEELILVEQEMSFQNLNMYEDSLSSPQERVQGHQKKKKLSKNKRLEIKEAARKKEICDLIRMGDLDKLEVFVKTLDIPQIENTETLKGLHDINEPLDENGNSPLHIAALCEEIPVIKFLLKCNADPCVKNKKLQTAYSCTQNSDVRDTFKDFAKEFPDKYNYNKAQIPISNLTPEEQEEKRKAQRKLKREKEKEKKKQVYVKKQEAVDKERFLNLSDREKRALAAERRILSQSGNVIARCFLCAIDISGKVPFEYSGYRFCSIQCLKAHRLQTPTVLSK